MNEHIRIKDIAEKAGVSVGTVDRILHNRPNVSAKSRAKVEAVLESINYKPNMYASALAFNKTFTFWCIIPNHDQEAYWDEIVEGIQKAEQERQDFHLKTEIHYYNRYEQGGLTPVALKCIEEKPDGVVIVPSELEETRQLTNKLHELNIPFVMLDSYMPDLRPLSFYGQDAVASGRLAARILMLVAHGSKEIAIVKPQKSGYTSSKQQQNREVGFRMYMADHFPSVKISEFCPPLDLKGTGRDELNEQFFKEHPDIHHAIIFSSRVHTIGNWLLRTNRRDIQIAGYDMVEKNAECLRQGSVSFLIAQHAFMQGYASVISLFDAVVLHKEVHPVNYMPIEILSPENVKFYRRQQL